MRRPLLALTAAAAASAALLATQTGDPVALTRQRLAGAVPRDAVVEPAGYPAAAERRFVRVRAGTHIVGVAVWHAMPQSGTWTLDALRVCAPLAAS